MKSNSRMKSRYDQEIEREISDLCQGLDILGIRYNDPVLEKFRIYTDALYTKKEKLHLLSQKDYKRIARRHYLTSLAAFDLVKGRVRVCDIGSGAGFPSMPLKIVNPEMKLTMIEAQYKKAEFLCYLTRRLGYPETNVVHRRIEEYSEGIFDILLFKAVGKIKTFKNAVDRLLAPRGRAIFFKTVRVREEISDDLKRKFRVRIIKVHTPLDQIPLALVILRKNQ